MLTKLIPIVGLLLCSCGIATQVTSIASFGVSKHSITLDSSGAGHFASATIDAELQPRLAAAFAAGQVPSYPLIGRDHAQWIRSLDISAGSDVGLYLLTAKALAPHPIRLSLSKRNSQCALRNVRCARRMGHCEDLIANTHSEVFNIATHFASVFEEVELQDGDVFVVRHEGAGLAFENVITVTLE